MYKIFDSIANNITKNNSLFLLILFKKIINKIFASKIQLKNCPSKDISGYAN